MFTPVSTIVRTLLLAIALTAGPLFAAEDQNLPELGDATSGIISLSQEHEIGQAFLRQLRGQVPMLEDPLLQDYLEHLIFRLAANSELRDRRLYLVLIDSPVINAFAAPGGVVGVNHGLFFYGESEHETAAILAHELAHLSQRHFARGVQQGRQSSMLSIAGLLASIVLMSTVGAEAGMAAMSTTQGLAQSQQLSYSRGREAEADRVGIDTLARANMDPRAMALMFERLDKSTRYSGALVPEFLRTHPVTRSRVSDSYNQAQSYPKADFPLSIDYQMMRARVRVMTANSIPDTIGRFKSALQSREPIMRQAAQYGLVLALTRNTEMDEAQRYLRPLQDELPHNIALSIAEAEIHTTAGRTDIALEVLEQALTLTPGNYPLSVAKATTLIAAQRPAEAATVLEELTTRRRDDEHIWYLLAEAYGLADDIAGVHEARAEFFVLRGGFDQAIKQLGYALPLVRDNFQQNARIKQRIEDIWKIRASYQ